MAEQNSEESIVGTTVGGRFRIDARIAAGGMGVVYKAEQQPLGRPVAVKILRAPQDPRMDESFSKRFLLEAAAVANLAHPNTVIVHDYGRDGEVLYFAMEFLEGMTLTARVRKGGPMAPMQALHVGKQVASSLDDAHRAGLVHRDLKPGNVMLISRGGDPDYVKVLDFGLVKMVTTEENVQLTQSGIMLGSPRYMSPEQVKGKDIDHRADIYSFGAMMCFCLTGQPPFPAGSQFEAMRAHVYTEPPRLRALNPECRASERIESIVLRCLAKDPAQRFQSMGEVLQAIAHAELAPEGDDEDGKPTIASIEGAPFPAPTPAPSMAGPAPSVVGPHAAGVTPTPAPSVVSSSQFSTPPAAPGPSPAAKWGLRIGAGLLVVAGAAGAALFFGRQQEPVVEPLTSRVEGALVPHEDPVDPGTEDPGQVVGQDPTETADPAVEAGPHRLTILSDPSPARVLRDGHDVGDTPLTVLIPDGETWEIELRARGHAPRTLRVRGGLQEEMTVALEPEAGARRPSGNGNGTRMVTTETMDTEMEPTMVTTPMMTGVGPGGIRNPWD